VSVTVRYGVPQPVSGVAGPSTTIYAPVAAVSETASPATLTISTSFPAPAVATGETASLATLAISTSFPAPAVATGETASPATLSITTSLPAPTVTAGGNAAVTPATLSITTSFPAPAVATGETASPATLAVATSFPAATVTGSAITQPPAGYCLFGAYPGSGNSDPGATYNGGTYEGSTMANRKLGCWYRYYQLSDCPTHPGSDDISLVAAGRTLVISLSSSFTVGSITYAAVAAGTYDTDLNDLASNINNLSSPCILVFGHEMELSGNSSYGTAAQFISAFQHVANVVRAGAPGMVAMAWVSSGTGSSVQTYYPGDAYVDWLGVDPYDPTLAKGSPTATYTPYITFLNTDPLAIAGGAGSGGGHGKPIGIFETGIEPSPSNSDSADATWINAIPACLNSLTTTWSSKYQLFMWFNDLTGTWNTAITPGSLAAGALATIGANSFFNPPGQTISPTTLAISTSFPAPTVRQDRNATPATLAISISFPAPTVTGSSASGASVTPASLQITTGVVSGVLGVYGFTYTNTYGAPGALLSTGTTVSQTTLTISTTFPGPVVATGETASPATLAVSTSFPGSTVTSSIVASPATLAVTTSFPAPTVAGSLTISPGLETFGFGTFPGSAAGLITGVVAQVNAYGSDVAMTGASYELWDGTNARIGSAQPGTASTSSTNVDAVTFIGATLAQLATIRTRIYGQSQPGNSGATESIGPISLSTVLLPQANAAIGFLAPAANAVLLAPAVTGVQNSAAPPTTLTAAAGFLQCVVNLVNATTLPAVLAVSANQPQATITAVDNAAISSSVLVCTTALPGPVVNLVSIIAQPSTLNAQAAQPQATISASSSVSLTAATMTSTASFLSPAVNLVSAAVLPAPLGVSTLVLGAVISAVINATFTRAALVVTAAFPAPAVTDNTDGPYYAASVNILGGGVGTWTNTSNVTGLPAGNVATWTIP
jgi:hypothetical protein